MKAELINHMGSDLTVVNAARVSFDKESDWGTEWPHSFDPELTERDQKLIAYLAKHNHWTPFSHVMVTMRETVPIFVARQRFKHMIGFTYNEVSRRYVNDDPEFFLPVSWRSAPDSAKQGSGSGTVTEAAFRQENLEGKAVHIKCRIDEAYDLFMKNLDGFYRGLIDAGVAPEQARMVLPQSMYTSYYVTGSLAAWSRAYKLRTDPHAQVEIQDLAKQWNDIIGDITELKHSWSALNG